MLGVKERSRLQFFVVSIWVSTIILFSAPFSFSGEILDNFDDGDAVGWERSPQNKDSKVFWGVKNKEVIFDPQGVPWQQAISQFNFTGKGLGIGDPNKWTDYELEVDLLHEVQANWPGGIRGRVDLETGSHYAIWLYPGDSRINLYSNPGWDINTGLVNLGQAAYKPEVNKFRTLKLTFEGDVIKVFYDGKMLIEKKDGLYKKGTVALDNQDKVVHYDNVRIRGAAIPNLNASPVSPAGKLATIWGEVKNTHQ
jgi:hypothetical protein